MTPLVSPLNPIIPASPAATLHASQHKPRIISSSETPLFATRQVHKDEVSPQIGTTSPSLAANTWTSLLATQRTASITTSPATTILTAGRNPPITASLETKHLGNRLVHEVEAHPGELPPRLATSLTNPSVEDKSVEQDQRLGNGFAVERQISGAHKRRRDDDKETELLREFRKRNRTKEELIGDQEKMEILSRNIKRKEEELAADYKEMEILSGNIKRMEGQLVGDQAKLIALVRIV